MAKLFILDVILYTYNLVLLLCVWYPPVSRAPIITPEHVNTEYYYYDQSVPRMTAVLYIDVPNVEHNLQLLFLNSPVCCRMNEINSNVEEIYHRRTHDLRSPIERTAHD